MPCKDESINTCRIAEHDMMNRLLAKPTAIWQKTQMGQNRSFGARHKLRQCFRVLLGVDFSSCMLSALSYGSLKMTPGSSFSDSYGLIDFSRIVVTCDRVCYDFGWSKTRPLVSIAEVPRILFVTGCSVGAPHHRCLSLYQTRYSRPKFQSPFANIH